MSAEGETEHTCKGSKSKIYWYLFTILHSTPILNWKMFLFARLSFRMIKGFELNNKRVTEEILIILFGIHFNKLLKLPLQISTRKETRIVLRTQSKEKLIWFKSDKSFLKSLLLRDWPGDVSDLRGDILIRFRLKLFSIPGNNILIKKGKEEIWLHLCFEFEKNLFQIEILAVSRSFSFFNAATVSLWISKFLFSSQTIWMRLARKNSLRLYE